MHPRPLAVLASLFVFPLALAADNGLQTLTTTEQTSPTFATLGPDGNLWVTETRNNSVFRVAPDGTGLVRFDSGLADRPNGITVGADGNLWFGSDVTNFIARLTPVGALTVFTGFGNASTRLVSICAGPDGNLWATDPTGESILRFSTNGVGTQFNRPLGSDPVGICAGPDGALWFTQFGSNKIGRITVAGAVTEFDVPTPDSGPQGICAGPFGTLAFTEAAASKIGIISTAGACTEFALPAGSQPDQIVLGPDGALWFTMIGTGKIGRMTFAGELTQFSASDPRAVPSGLAVGADRVFFIETVASAVRSAPVGLPTVRLAASAFRLGEKAGALSVPILRSGVLGTTATVTFATANGTATAPDDFKVVATRVTFAAKKAAASVKIPIVGDANTEGDETFTISLDTTADGGVLVADPATATVTIVDNTAQTFPGFSGTYAGALDPLSVPADAALFSLTLNGNASFTATLLTAGGRLQIKGQLDADGHFTGVIPRGSLPPLQLTLDLEQTGSGTLHGTLSDGLGTQPLTALRGTFHAKTNAAPQAGRYTVLLPAAQAPGVGAPVGIGFGTLVVNAAGKVKLAASLGDGAKISAGGQLSDTGVWPFFATAYTPKGALSGALTFSDLAQSDAAGTLHWFRPANAKSAFFPGGFATTVAASASAFAVAPGGLVLPFAAISPNGIVSFAGGDLGAALPDQNITVAADNKVTGTAPFKFTFQLKTGLFSGSVLPPGARKARTFGGAVHQKRATAQGFFPGDAETGAVTVTVIP